jgi:RNA polymerase sigma-70 factor, ECF subfamily
LEQLEKKEISAQINKALNSLPEAVVKVIELVDIEGLSYQEAAQVLKVPVNTLRTRLKRARAKLKINFEKMDSEKRDEKKS